MEPALGTKDHSIGCGDARAATPRVLWLQGISVAWMLVECGVALWAAWAAQSVVLLTFGADSFIELLSSAVVLLQFSPALRLSRERAARAAGWLLYALAAAVVLIAALALWGRREASPSWAGMIITALALVVMPLLAWAKRRIARQTNDRALAADAVQSATCAYLAAVALIGLAANAVFHLPWLDSAAAVLCVPAIVIEAQRAMRGEACECGGWNCRIFGLQHCRIDGRVIPRTGRDAQR